MKKKFATVVNSLLASAIIMLGVGSCKTSSKLATDNNSTNGKETIDPAQPDPNNLPYILPTKPNPKIEPAVTVYGPPPARREVEK